MNYLVHHTLQRLRGVSLRANRKFLYVSLAFIFLQTAGWILAPNSKEIEKLIMQQQCGGYVAVFGFNEKDTEDTIFMRDYYQFLNDSFAFFTQQEFRSVLLMSPPLDSYKPRLLKILLTGKCNNQADEIVDFEGLYFGRGLQL